MIVCALHCEAKPLIQHFHLKKDLEIKSHQVFSSQEYQLIISGTSKIKSAVATAFLCAKILPQDLQLIINVGICGGSPKFSIGSILFINKIVCQSSKRSFYPDILIKHQLKEAQILTAEQPFGQEDPLASDVDLVDLEAAGFFQAANLFVSPDKIGCLKVVSDHFRPRAVAAQKVEELIRARIVPIDETLKAYTNLSCQYDLPNNTKEMTEFTDIFSQTWRLTHSQKQQLAEWLTSYLSSGRTDLNILDKYQQKAPKDKNDVKRLLCEIKHTLFDD